MMRYLLRLPIRWKLTLWSTVLICFLFLAYNVVQFFVLQHWVSQNETQSITKSMDDIVGYFQSEKGAQWDANELQRSKSFIEAANQNEELIRVLDATGKPILTSEHHMPSDWVKPQTVQQRQIFNVNHRDERLLVMRAPLTTSYFTGTVEIIRNSEKIDKLIQLILTFVIAGGVGGILLSAILGYFLSGKLLQPVKTLTDTMKGIRGEGLTQRVQVATHGDELSDLSTIFNEMMDRVEHSFNQQKQFIEDASHELRTPLQVLEGHVSLLKRWGKHEPEILDESLEAITQETKRLQVLVKELLDLTRAESLQTKTPANTEVTSVLEHVVHSLEVLYPDFVFDMQSTIDEQVQIAVRPEHVEQILFIVLDNAIKYSTQKKHIEIRSLQQGNGLVIQVVDYGEGIPAKDLPFVFDRFYRVDKARSRKVGGTGLGLSIAHRLMSAYHGTIHVHSEEGKGTTVELRFPL
jgi:two-component system, OmpR family, sensor histidine kinase ArlS